MTCSKRSGFKSSEFLQVVALASDEWAPESGLVTAVRKIQRKTVAQRYGAEISVCFFLNLLVMLRHVVIFAHARTQAYHNSMTTNHSQEVFGGKNETFAGKPRRFFQSIVSSPPTTRSSSNILPYVCLFCPSLDCPTHTISCFPCTFPRVGNR